MKAKGEEMSMEEYKELACIRNLDEDLKTAFYQIVDNYKNELSPRIIMGSSAYTLHDFDHHCFDIYKIISDVLFDNTIAYLKDAGITQRELYVLNLSVLFHDIGMTRVGGKRENHAISSAKYVEGEYKNSKSVFGRQSNLNKNELKALMAIIKAHSDPKGNYAVPPEKSGLHADDIVDYPAHVGTIRTLFLAAVLRIADELDVSQERLGNSDLEQEIKEYKESLESKKSDEKSNSDELEELNISLTHWKRLRLISHIERDKTNPDIILYIDDDEIDNLLAAGKTLKTVAADLADLINGIKKKFVDAVSMSFQKEPYCKFVTVRNIKYKSKNDLLLNEIEGVNAYRDLSEVKLEQRDNLSDKEESVKHQDEKVEVHLKVPQVIDKKLEEKISKEIENRKLIKYGHYRLNEKLCARDWLDTREVVETKELLNEIVNAIVKDINLSSQENVLIVGVDLVGALIASRVSFALQFPMTYIVSPKNEKNNAKQEVASKELLESGKKVIMITDVIVSFSTIRALVRAYNLKEYLLGIYTIFYRPGSIECKDSDYIGLTHSINNTFIIELVNKKNCIYDSQKCIAQNRTINEEILVNENN